MIARPRAALLCSPALAAASALLAACGAASPPVAKARDARAGDRCADGHPASALLVSLAPADRAALGRALRGGSIAAVAYDCSGLRVLPSCRVEGHYTWIGIEPKRSVIALASPDEARWTAPAAPGADPVRAPTSLALLLAGRLTATRDGLTRADVARLAGPGDACAGATHIVRAADVGASGPPSAVFPDCSSASKLETTAPPPACADPVRVHLAPIDAPVSPEVARGMPILACPPGSVLADEKCTTPDAARFQCRYGDVEPCREQCAKGHAGSCATLGWMFVRGAPGIEPDAASALKLSLGACDAGEPFACGNAAVALSALDGSAGDKIAALFLTSCSRGDAGSCLELGLMLGRSDAPDPEALAMRRRVFGRACDAGSVAGCGNFAAIFLGGAGAPPDLERARALYERACGGGEPGFCAPLGLMAMRGDGGPADPRRAIDLLRSACDVGVPSSCAYLGLFYQSGEVVEQDYAAAGAHFEKACSGGAPHGCRLLGYLFENAFGRPRDLERASGLYAKGCGMKEAESCVELGRLHLEGKGILKDERRAAQLFEQACEAGSPVACHNLALLHELGQGAAKDEARASELHRRACEGGFERSCRRVPAAKP